MTIRRATDADLACIRQWLEETGSGFLNNWSIIEEGHLRGEVIVAVSHDTVLAFCLGDATTLSIFETREDKRGQGIGRALAKHYLAAARQAGSWGVSGFCSPRESLGFWERVGFERVFDPGQEYQIAYAFRQCRNLPVGPEVHKLSFVLNHYFKDEIYRARTIPATHQDGRYLLAEDFVEYIAISDMQLTIGVGDKPVYVGKCKNAMEVGGDYDSPWVRFQVVAS